MKVDDTPMGMEAARNAGCWAVGLSASGNALGVSAAEWAEMSDANRVSALRPIESTFREAGADFVIPTAADLPAVLLEIAARLSADDRRADAVHRRHAPRGDDGAGCHRKNPPAPVETGTGGRKHQSALKRCELRRSGRVGGHAVLGDIQAAFFVLGANPQETHHF